MIGEEVIYCWIYAKDAGPVSVLEKLTSLSVPSERSDEIAFGWSTPEAGAWTSEGV